MKKNIEDFYLKLHSLHFEKYIFNSLTLFPFNVRKHIFLMYMGAFPV